MTVALKDQNSVASAIFESSSTSGLTLRGKIDEATGRILVDAASGGGTGTNYNVSGTIDGSNTTFTIAVAVTSDFSLFLARQPQAPITDYSYVAGASSTTIKTIGKGQIDTLNTAGTEICAFWVGTTLTTVTGACN